MKFDPSYLYFISKQELRILAAVQMGMRNHQYVSKELITRIGNLKGGQTFKTIQKLLKNKFIVHIGNKCNGYKLTNMGYDYLALNTFMKRGLIKQVLSKIGVGKQSDIYKCKTPDGEYVVLKLTRLGRNSFRSIKKNREYIQHRTNYNWLYLSRLSSIRQFLFMQLLHKYNFPVPKPIDTNRHGILMSLIDGDAFCRVQRISTQAQIRKLFQSSIQTLVNFAKHGLIHGDYNEFNLMVNQDGSKITVIDFPQCISINHPNAEMYFNRDVHCVYKYFDKLAEKSYQEYLKYKEEGDLGEKMFNAQEYPMPQLQDIQPIKRLDHQIKDVGHISLQQYNLLEKYRTEEERMRSEMEEGQQQLEQEDEEQDDIKEQSSFQLQKQQKQIEELQKELQGQQINAIEGIKQPKQNQIDEELTNLINQFDHPLQLQKEQQQQQEQQSQQEQEQRFKGMTAYQIRMKIKQQKRIQRQKKKEQMTTNEMIKKSLKKNNKFKKYIPGKGNHGNKDKIKQRNAQIKNDFF